MYLLYMCKIQLNNLHCNGNNYNCFHREAQALPDANPDHMFWVIVGGGCLKSHLLTLLILSFFRF